MPSLLLPLALSVAVACQGGIADSAPIRTPSAVDSMGQAYVSSVKVNVLGRDRVRLLIRGDLPTPCHEVRSATEVRSPPKGVIRLRVWSVAPTEAVCQQVLAPFKTAVEVGSLDPGAYTVRMAGQPVGSFEL